MNTTRRQFVVTGLSAVPVLSLAGFAAAQRGPSTADPVWAQIEADLARIEGELAQARPTRQTLRAFESTLRFHAAHSAARGNAGRLQSAVREQLRERGRAAFLADIADSSHRHQRLPLRPEWRSRLEGPRRQSSSGELEAVVDAIAQGHYVSMLQEAANGVNVVGDLAGADGHQGLRPIAAIQFFPNCDQYGQIVAGMEFLRDVVCLVAAINPAILPECLALAAEVLLMQMVDYWVCDFVI